MLDYSLGAYKGKGTGEQSLLREILPSCFNKNDIMLGDKYYPSYFLLWSLKLIGAHGFFQGQGQRNYDFRKGIKLGGKDHVIEWSKPTKPEWMDEDTYQSISETIPIREFKVKGVVYVTTFLNPKKHNKNELAKLYQRRWQVEINLKYIKDILSMNILTCKTPSMIKKEIATHMLAYNIIRILIAESGFKHDVEPSYISFKGTLQLLNKFMPYFLSQTQENDGKTFSLFLKSISANRIGNRPGRIEPRVVKRRQKPYKRMQQPRAILRKKINKKIQSRLNAAA